MHSSLNFTSQFEIRDRWSVSTNIFRGFRPVCRESLEEIAGVGIQQIELLESPDQFDLGDRRSVHGILRTCRSIGISIIAYHAHHTTFYDVTDSGSAHFAMDRALRQIDTLAEAGGRIWGCHIVKAEGWPGEALAMAARRLEGTAICLCVENFNKPSAMLEDRITWLRTMNHPNLGLLLDIGHVRDASGHNPMAEPGGPSRCLDLCGPFLRHLHLHGFVNGVDHFPPFADGDAIRWGELFVGLHLAAYEGWFNFEPRGPQTYPEVYGKLVLAPARIEAAELDYHQEIQGALHA